VRTPAGRVGTWARSEFPHPLVTLDFDEAGTLLGVVVVGADLSVEAE
jgi:hypothetical protein